MSPTRPLIITIIGSTLLGFAIIGTGLTLYLLITSGLALENTVVVLAVFTAASLVQVILALGILNGKNWARILFLWLTPVDVAVGIAGGGLGAHLVFKAGYFIVFAYFLTRPASNAYFQAVKSRDRWAYGVVGCWIVMSALTTFSPQIMSWAEMTYRIGYVRHDIASLKLPSGWVRTTSARPVPDQWHAAAGRVDLASIAWGGLRATDAPQIDIETGETSTFNNKGAFEFEAGHVRDDGTLMPCGLARYRLTFPSDVKDPLRQILTSQLLANGSATKHQYHWEKAFRLLELDVTSRGARFLVWNWWRQEEPGHVYGMVIGMPEKTSHQQDECGASGIVKSLQLKRSDDWVWRASELNAASNPGMTPVSALFIEMGLDRFLQLGIEPSAFFSWLEKQLGGSAHEHTPGSVLALRYGLNDGREIVLGDIANARRAGGDRGSRDDPWRPVIVELDARCPLQEHDLQLIRQARDSVVSLHVSFRASC